MSSIGRRRIFHQETAVTDEQNADPAERVAQALDETLAGLTDIYPIGDLLAGAAISSGRLAETRSQIFQIDARLTAYGL